MKLALFDIDGTLVTGRSEVMFWRYLFRRRKQGLRQVLAWAGYQVRNLPSRGAHAARTNKAYLVGLDVEGIEALAAAFVAGELVPMLFPPAVRRVKEHLDRGDVVVLLSGTLEPVARALADHLGVPRVCATRCATRDGRYLSRPPQRHPFGDTKLALARELAREAGTDLDHAFAYGDSRHDLPLLSAVGHPVAVRPDDRLRQKAVGRDWEILDENAPAGPGAGGTAHASDHGEPVTGK